jgi:hypothetical protein
MIAFTSNMFVDDPISQNKTIPTTMKKKVKTLQQSTQEQHN